MQCSAVWQQTSPGPYLPTPNQYEGLAAKDRSNVACIRRGSEADRRALVEKVPLALIPRVTTFQSL
jgi:hypothetical protein